MSWREAVEPVRMERVAIVAPRPCLRDALVLVAASGQVDLDPPVATEHASGPAARRLLGMVGDQPVRPALTDVEIDLDRLVELGRADLVAGEAELEARAADASERDGVAALTGWAVAGSLPDLRAALGPVGGAVARLTPPQGVDPPTLLPVGGELHEELSPLVETYGTVPYADVDPTVVAGLAYVAMFGMMFGDLGHGLLLVLAGLLLRSGRIRRLAKVAKAWPFVLGAGVAASLVGVLYGEFFGPTGVLTPLWLSPTEEPVTLLVAGIGVGAVLLAGAYALGTVNRWREGGWPLALYAPSGAAGIALFLGLAAVALGGYFDGTWGARLVPAGVVVWVAGLLLVFVGLLYGAGLHATGVLQAVVELFDTVIQVGANLVSFARLAAFGLAHAALAGLVWEATRDLSRGGPVDWLWAVVIFALGNTLAFTLEALVAAVQALRLEYYELFSRVFQSEGRPFRPWHIPMVSVEQAPERSESPS
jgi:V/A-type H+-transporting ATPase subunit I